VKVATGTIVDATIINAPSSTKNGKKARGPDMHQTKKGNQWYFGMKAHFGIDSRSKPALWIATAVTERGEKARLLRGNPLAGSANRLPVRNLSSPLQGSLSLSLRNG
jgi:IS5 family transposase